MGRDDWGRTSHSSYRSLLIHIHFKMIAISRIATFLFFILSLGLLTCAAPTVAKTNELAVRSGNAAALLDVCIALEANLNAHLDACANIDVKSDAQVELIAKVVADIDVSAKAVADIGVCADVDVKVKAEIVARIAAIVT
ncbi:unnamed protein product, partial [Rhizoctonia solani]